MQIIIPEKLKILAAACPKPLYAVGGYVRNFLIGGIKSEDLDIAGAMTAEEISVAAARCSFKVVAEYKRTGTAVISDGERKYEYTRFRTDRYAAGGAHTPCGTEFTDDIELDARRRDFKCNAVYYDIVKESVVDPLCGRNDISSRTIDTVVDPEFVFKSDGLRLMRLARFSAELGFTPKKEVLFAASEFADNIKDIAPERIFAEIKKILVSDEKYPFSDKAGHFSGVKILRDTGVLKRIIPELSQKHKDDRAFFTLLHAEKNVRLAALLYEAVHALPDAARERMAREILKRLKADNRTAERTAALLRYVSFDGDGKETESAVRLFVVKNADILQDLISLKIAEHAATSSLTPCPTVEKWRKIYEKMRSDGTPFSLKQLKISPDELKDIGFNGKRLGKELETLFDYAVTHPESNGNSALRVRAARDFESLR